MPFFFFAAIDVTDLNYSIQLIVLLDNPGESVNSFTKIGLTGYEKDFFYFGSKNGS
jgi:hypothetical protein